MRKYIFVLTGLITVFAITGCKKKGCTDATAANYNSEAKKDDGSCHYAPDPRDAYTGSYLVTDSLFMMGSFSEIKVYTLQVSTGGTKKDTIYLNNLSDSGKNFHAILTGSNFSIPSQQVSGPYYLNGNGNFGNNAISYQTSGDVYVNKGEGTN